MIEIVCKTCGARNKYESLTSELVCEYCEVPLELDEKWTQYANLYMKADDAYERKDFDEALQLYEQIVELDNLQSEAHWGAALCRYGVAYVPDPLRDVKIPTCNRINRTSILDDKNYLAAIRYAGTERKAKYMRLAQEIDRISKRFLAIVEKEKPYDVFISYKKTGFDDKRTIDSQYARKLYQYLTNQGIKVFFAEETLDQVGGEMYEPYIFAALTSAKVMVLLGSCKEHFEAVWVKNEWRRFMMLSQEDPSKALIPAFVNCKPEEELPMGLNVRQALDATGPAFCETVLSIVRKKMDAAPQAAKAGNLSILSERYATKEKVAAVVDALDCEPDLAAEALIVHQGKTDAVIRFISTTDEYKKIMWACAECGSRNTHDACHNPNCGISRADSINIKRKREEAERQLKEQQRREEERRRKEEEKRRREYERSAEVKRAKAARRAEAAGKFFGGLLTVVIVLAVLGGIGFGGYKLYTGVIQPAIHNNATADSFYTPELVQTYVGTYTNGDAIITFTECSQSGVLQGTFEFVVDENYGQYKVTGTITDKKNSGEVTMTLTAGEWIIQPNFFTPLDEITLKFSEDHQTVTSNKYNMQLTAGEFSEFAISTAEDLQKLSGSSMMYTLKNDIDLSGVKWTPIEGFTGTLVGGGYTIKNLTIEADGSNIGFFGTLEGVVKDLNFENASVTVTGRNENVGILCGYLSGSAMDVSVSGAVEAKTSKYVGGVIGQAYKQISSELALKNLSSSADVTGLSYVGGVAGQLFGSYVQISATGFANSGTVTASEDYAGGLVGYAETEDFDPVTIYDSENTGDVTGQYYVGGVVGYAKSRDYENSVISNTSSAANITGEAYVGGIAGCLISVLMNDCSNAGSTLTATGSVTDDDVRCAYLGGFAGIGCDVTNCTNEVAISYTGGGAYVGGILGYSFQSISPDMLLLKNVTNNAPVSGADYVGGIIGYALCEYLAFQVESAENNADVTGSGDYVGGIVGFCSARDNDGNVNIYDSVNAGKVSGNSYVGGILGYGRAYGRESAISGCSNSGSIKGKSNKGDIAGEVEDIVIG